MHCIHCGEILGNNDIAMEHAGKCPVMTGDFSPPDTELQRRQPKICPRCGSNDISYTDLGTLQCNSCFNGWVVTYKS